MILWDRREGEGREGRERGEITNLEELSKGGIVFVALVECSNGSVVVVDIRAVAFEIVSLF